MLRYFYIILIIWNWNETEFRDPKMKADVGVLKALLKCSIHPPGSLAASPMAEGTLSTRDTSGGPWLAWAQWAVGTSSLDRNKSRVRTECTEINDMFTKGWAGAALLSLQPRKMYEICANPPRREKLTVRSSGNGGKRNTERKNPLKFYLPGLDFKKQKVIPEERLLMRGFFGW